MEQEDDYESEEENSLFDDNFSSEPFDSEPNVKQESRQDEQWGQGHQ
jgi:hypothetical protein